MKALVVFALATSVCCATATAVVYVTLRGDVEELQWQLELQAQTTELQAEDSTPVHEEEADRLPRIETRVSLLEKRIQSLGKGSPERDPNLPPSSSGSVSPTTVRGQGENPDPPGAASEKEASLAKKMKELESKLGEVQKKLEDNRNDEKPKFSQFAARLDLDPHQRQAVQDILHRGKTELLEHLQRPLPDGTVLIDELADMYFMTSKDPKEAEERGKKVFMRLFSEKVPGTEKTYIEVFGELNGRLKTEMKDRMNDEQKKKYDEWSPNATDIELTDDPVNKYIMEYVKRKNEESGR
jgi:hypothetical protein